jgi:ABC-type methionine transport system ATPase subunit
MAKLRVRFTFPTERVTEPVIWQLGREFQVVTNIRRADIRADSGWVVLEMTGEDAEIQRSLQWVRSVGVQVELVGGDVLES